MKRTLLFLTVIMTALSAAPALWAQDIPMAVGPGSYVAAGIGASAFYNDYGQRTLGGYTAFVDAHITWRYGLEAEARSLTINSDEDVTMRTYLAGPHVYVWKPRAIRPYVKFLVGQGHMVYPFKYATGNFLALAPGAGLDFNLGHVVSIRAIDIEYQDWPEFSCAPQQCGPLHPYGVSAGIYFRLNPMRFFPRKARPDYKLR